MHKICSVYKMVTSNVANCRPISLLSIFSKALEKIVYQKFLQFSNSKISNSQFGLRQMRSWLTELLTILDEVYKYIDQRSCSDSVYMDFRKAFDSIPHSEFLYKIWVLGITGPMWFWLKEYLSGRLHYVEVDVSHRVGVVSRVLQESILGHSYFCYT